MGSSRQLDAELYTPAFAPYAQLLILEPRASPAGQPIGTVVWVGVTRISQVGEGITGVLENVVA